MQLAARSYLAAGVALVGAGAIAVTPVAPSIPQVHAPVALTASVDNPLTVFHPAVDAAQTLILNVIERQASTPAPILRQLILNAVAGFEVYRDDPINVGIQAFEDAKAAAAAFGPNLNALADTTSTAATALGDGLSGLLAGLPAALEAATDEFAAGDPGGAIDAVVLAGMQHVVNILIFAVNPEINAVGQLLNVPQPLINATTEATIGAVLAVAAATVGVGSDIPGQPRPLVKQVLVGAQDLVNAATSGDPINVVNALQHGAADLATSAAFQIDATLSMINYAQDTFVSALRQITPVHNPARVSLIAPATEAIAAKGNEETPAPIAAVATVATDTAAAADAPEANTPAKVSTKVSTKVGAKHATATTDRTSARERVTTTAKKLAGGLRSDRSAGAKARASKSSSTRAGAKAGAAKSASSGSSAKGSRG